ncbi:hypothetical protein [Dermabacter hominis]|uniref:hypothetical protein n=1 Tax=Dermabacter hominis TaxID=36740 RepID=UPI003AAEF604
MPTPEQRHHDLARLRRVRDRIDREFDQPLDLEDLTRGDWLRWSGVVMTAARLRNCDHGDRQ